MKNLEIEKSILSMLMTDSDLMLEDEVNENDFTTPTHKKLFAAIQNFGSNFALIQGKFQDEEAEYISSIASFSIGLFRRKSDYEELKRLTEMRRINTIARGIQIAIADDQSLDLIYEKIQNFEKIKEEKADIQSILIEIVAELTGTKNATFYPTDYPSLDQYLGGFTPGQLNIIAARPSVGKTLFAMNVALKQVKAGRKVAFYSLEMTNKEIVQRILARNSGMPVSQMKKQATQEQLSQVNSAIDLLTDQLKNLTLIDNLSTISSITRSIKYLHKKEGLDLVYIDYLGLIVGKGENKNIEITKITRTLKLLARQLNITIVLLSQLNRAVENRVIQDPKLSDLRDSGSIEQDADIILMLARDLEDDKETLNVLIRKNRNGELAEVKLACKPASMQVGEKQNPF